MKLSYPASSLILFAIISSCSDSDNDTPEYQKSTPLLTSISCDDVAGGNQAFKYSESGKITEWSIKYSDNEYALARYSYPDDYTILVESEDVFFENTTNWTETIQLKNGRATKSEGTFMRKQNENVLIMKSYRLEFAYEGGTHLTEVKHSEVVGLNTDTPSVWDEAWSWENHLMWENGNLKEFENYQGKNVVSETTEYDYYEHAAALSLINPVIINALHHTPLLMQGIFGANSKNQMKSASVFDKDGNFCLSREYTYKCRNDGLIDDYVETTVHNTSASNSILYKVNWATK